MTPEEENTGQNGEEPEVSVPKGGSPTGDEVDAGLEEALREALAALEQGETHVLLDDTPLAGLAALDDDAPIVPPGPEELVASSDDLSTPPSGVVSVACEEPPVTEERAAPISEPGTPFGRGEIAETGAVSSVEKAVLTDEMALSQADLDALVAAQRLDGGAERPAEKDMSVSTEEEAAPLPRSVTTGSVNGSNGEKAADAKNGSPGDTGGIPGQPKVDELLSQMESAGKEVRETQKAGADQVSQADLDTLLTELGDDHALDSSSPDTRIDAGITADDQAASLNQSELDALIAGMEKGAEAEAAGAAPAASSGSSDYGAVSQEMIDALIAAAQKGESAGQVGSENLEAAATMPEPQPRLLTQEDIDKVLDEARSTDRERRISKQRAIEQAVAEAEKKAKTPSVAPEGVVEMKPEAEAEAAIALAPNRLGLFFYENLPRIVMSLAAGLLVGLATFTVLYRNQERTPEVVSVVGGKMSALEAAMQRAAGLMADGDFWGAASILERPIARSTPGPMRSDAEYMRLEALWRGFHYEPGSRVYDALHGEIDRIYRETPDHPRAAEALYWKAKLYEMDDLPYAAQDLYREILEHYRTGPKLDEILLDAAKLSNTLVNPQDAAEYAQRLLKQYPGSPLAGEARLCLGDSYALAGMEDDARTLYVRVAQAEPSSRLGAEAYLRLGRAALKQGRYDEAIQHLETRLQTALTTAGNDEVYLALAQAYRARGRLEEARNSLNDVLNFFPETQTTPEALVELSQVTDELGERQAALQLAQQAATRYPDNPKALKNKGVFLGLEGDAFGAAAALIAADDAGANDPALLLSAARYYRTLGALDAARETYDRVRQKYAGTPAALTGGIEGAEVIYALGHVDDAVERLRNLAQTTEGTPHHLPALRALSRIYTELAMNPQAIDIGRKIASSTSEPAILAETASSLLEAGALEEAQELMDRIPWSRVPESTAYSVLMKYGKALRQVDPRRALETMENAYLTYPRSRNAEDEEALLEVYLSGDRSAAARRLVMEKSAQARDNPILIPELIDAAIMWGDYLYTKRDYRSAADAYGLAVDAASQASTPARGTRRDPAWAKYQRANALLELSDYRGSLALFQEIAGSDAPWAAEAGIKAEYARLEQRLRSAEASMGVRSGA